MQNTLYKFYQNLNRYDFDAKRYYVPLYEFIQRNWNGNSEITNAPEGKDKELVLLTSELFRNLHINECLCLPLLLHFYLQEERNKTDMLEIIKSFQVYVKYTYQLDNVKKFSNHQLYVIYFKLFNLEKRFTDEFFKIDYKLFLNRMDEYILEFPKIYITEQFIRDLIFISCLEYYYDQRGIHLRYLTFEMFEISPSLILNCFQGISELYKFIHDHVIHNVDKDFVYFNDRMPSEIRNLNYENMERKVLSNYLSDEFIQNYLKTKLDGYYFKKDKTSFLYFAVDINDIELVNFCIDGGSNVHIGHDNIQRLEFMEKFEMYSAREMVENDFKLAYELSPLECALKFSFRITNYNITYFKKHNPKKIEEFIIPALSTNREIIDRLIQEKAFIDLNYMLHTNLINIFYNGYEKKRETDYVLERVFQLLYPTLLLFLNIPYEKKAFEIIHDFLLTQFEDNKKLLSVIQTYFKPIVLNVNTHTEFETYKRTLTYLFNFNLSEIVFTLFHEHSTIDLLGKIKFYNSVYSPGNYVLENLQILIQKFYEMYLQKTLISYNKGKKKIEKWIHKDILEYGFTPTKFQPFVHNCYYFMKYYNIELPKSIRNDLNSTINKFSNFVTSLHAKHVNNLLTIFENGIDRIADLVKKDYRVDLSNVWKLSSVQSNSWNVNTDLIPKEIIHLNSFFQTLHNFFQSNVTLQNPININLNALSFGLSSEKKPIPIDKQNKLKLQFYYKTLITFVLN